MPVRVPSTTAAEGAMADGEMTIELVSPQQAGSQESFEEHNLAAATDSHSATTSLLEMLLEIGIRLSHLQKTRSISFGSSRSQISCNFVGCEQDKKPLSSAL